MRRVAILIVVTAGAVLMVTSVSALAAPPPPVIQVTGSGSVQLQPQVMGPMATVTIDAQTVGEPELLYTGGSPSYPYWQGKAKGFVTIAVEDEGFVFTARVTGMSSMFEIYGGVSMKYKYKGVTYSMYVTESSDGSHGIWLDDLPVLGVRTAYAPSEVEEDSLVLTYPKP